jgi:hypothetical protein
MVTRGDDGELKMPMTVRGPNFLVKGGASVARLEAARRRSS